MLKEKPRKSQNNGIFAGRKSQTRVRGLFNNRTGVFLCQGSRPQTASMSCKPVLQELNRSQEQVEIDQMENVLGLQTELKVTVFVKWFFLVLGIMTASPGLYFVCKCFACVFAFSSQSNRDNLNIYKEDIILQ